MTALDLGQHPSPTVPPAILDRVRADLASADAVFEGPFGPRRLIYADYTASGRSLGLIEAAMDAMVRPFYGNTHSEASYTGRQTTELRERAREAVRRGVRADQQHAVIFCGSGSTSAINKLVAMLGLRLPALPRDREAVERAVPEAKRPVVIVGPYEHHSNELPWRESLATVVRLPLDAGGTPCLATLARVLAEYADRPQRFVSLSAASNVTGVKTDIKAAARLVHAADGLIFVDFAAGAPYMPIDVAGSGDGDHLDAVFLSPHKFVGGPGASGVLVADRALHAAGVPTAPGGGTVAFVTPTRHRYLADIEHIEEAGTPSIPGDIRAGLVMQLKSDIGVDAIHSAERRAVARAFERWRATPGVQVLGPAAADRLAIFSFNVRAGNRRLHHGFVVNVLNDLFGLQARGGCSCAGPYGHDLLGIDAVTSAKYEAIVAQGYDAFKPGWVRVGFSYTCDEPAIDAIIDAVAFVARRGKDLLSLYSIDARTGSWQPVAGRTPLRVGFADLCAGWRGEIAAPAACEAPDFASCMAAAEALADEAARMTVPVPEFPPQGEELRWFWLPGER